MTTLGYRARRILHALVTEHIGTGAPVGSRTLSRHYGFDLSSASIRNVLADLEDDGYLQQPHASAGRVPTEHGLRVFVESLLSNIGLTNAGLTKIGVSDQDKAEVVRRLSGPRHGDDIMSETGQMLSAMTGGAALILTAGVEQEPLCDLRFLSVRAQHVLAVVITRSGNVENRVFPIAEPLSLGELERVHNYLQTLVAGRNLQQLHAQVAAELATEKGEYRALKQRVKDLLAAASEGRQDTTRIVVEGRASLFDQPEFDDVEKLKAMMRAFEDKSILLALLDGALSVDGVRVLIGSEVRVAEAPALSLISAGYKRDGRAVGTVGVIGPARIDYAKVVPLVEFTAHVMTDLLERRDS